MHILRVLVGILIFFLIYWILPNRKVPARAVLPTAIVIGVLWEAAKFLYMSCSFRGSTSIRSTGCFTSR